MTPTIGPMVFRSVSGQGVPPTDSADTLFVRHEARIQTMTGGRYVSRVRCPPRAAQTLAQGNRHSPPLLVVRPVSGKPLPQCSRLHYPAEFEAGEFDMNYRMMAEVALADYQGLYAQPPAIASSATTCSIWSASSWWVVTGRTGSARTKSLRRSCSRASEGNGAWLAYASSVAPESSSMAASAKKRSLMSLRRSFVSSRIVRQHVAGQGNCHPRTNL